MKVEQVDNRPMRVFDGEVVRLLEGVSADVLKSSVCRQHPNLAAFAFYVRRANLIKLQERLRLEEGRLGRGLCFHITPANIPVNFAFSWVFSLLAGNANIVRLPSKPFPQVDALLTVIQSHLEQEPELSRRNVFVRYPRTDTEMTMAYCAVADCRMIWGGDRTIAAIKAMPAMPRCVDVAFADRYSLAILDGNAILAADRPQMERLASGFYNDTYLMDQNACSSPQIILWEHDSPEARTKFWAAVEEIARQKYVLQDAVAVDKYTLLCEEAVRNPSLGQVARSNNLLYRLELTALPDDLFAHRGKGGFFFEYALDNREELFAQATEKFQTITQFGIDSTALRRQIIEHGLRGIDRIVPIGQAMNIGVDWDGYDLIRTLSRHVEAI